MADFWRLPAPDAALSGSEDEAKPRPAAAAFAPAPRDAEPAAAEPPTWVYEARPRGAGEGAGGCGDLEASDVLMLCMCEGDGKEEAAKVYTHLPSPATVASGLLHGGRELRAPRPSHALRLSASGQTFSFEVSLQPLLQAGGALAFAGANAHAETVAPPWNPLDREAHDSLWDWEAKECLDLIPAVCCMAALAADPELPFGPLPAAAPAAAAAPPGAAALALLQAVLHTSVTMWPIAFPDDVRARWEYGLRALRHTLSRCKEAAADADLAFDAAQHQEHMARCLKALKEVPNDDGSCSSGGCLGFGHRLKRMERSALVRLPLRGALNLRTAIAEAGELWPKFMEETEV